MNQYVNQSMTEARGGNFAPSVSYNQIEPRKELMKWQNRPKDNFQNENTEAVADLFNTIGAVGGAGLSAMKGYKDYQKDSAEAAKKKKAEEDEANKLKYRNALAKELRVVAARHDQGKIGANAAQRQMRAIGDKYIGLLSEEDVHSVESTHNFGTFEIEKARKTKIQANEIENREAFADSVRKNNPYAYAGMTTAQINNEQSTMRNDYFNYQRLKRQFDATTDENARKSLLNQMQGSLSGIIGINFDTSMRALANGQGMDKINEAAIEDWKGAMIAKLEQGGLPNRDAILAVNNYVNMHPLTQAVQSQQKSRLLSKDFLDSVTGVRESTAKEFVTRDPVLNVLKAGLGQAYNTLIENHIVGDSSGVYSDIDATTSEHLKSLLTSGSMTEDNKQALKGDLPALLKGVSTNINNPQAMTTYTATVISKNLLDTFNAAQSDIQTQQDVDNAQANYQIIEKDIDSIRGIVQEALKSNDPELVAQARMLDVNLQNTEAGRAVTNLLDINKNAKASSIQRLNVSTAKDRLRYDPQTLEVYLAPTQGFTETAGEFFSNTLTGEYDDNIKDLNESLKRMIQDPTQKKIVLDLLKIKEGRSGELLPKGVQPYNYKEEQ